MRPEQARLIPHTITMLRALSAPILCLLIVRFQFNAALACLAFAIMSDAIDGPLTRWIGTPSKAGAYFDASADCAVIIGGFAGLAEIGSYPAWTVGLIVAAFLVFVVTSRFTPAIYDPVGRHIGGLLFLSIGATLLFPDFFIQAVLLVVVSSALLTTITARVSHTLMLARR